MRYLDNSFLVAYKLMLSFQFSNLLLSQVVKVIDVSSNLLMKVRIYLCKFEFIDVSSNLLDLM